MIWKNVEGVTELISLAIGPNILKMHIELISGSNVVCKDTRVYSWQVLHTKFVVNDSGPWS